jgi:hypothetical protein
LCWQKVKDGVGDNQNIEGKDGITYHEFDRYPRTSQYIDGDHDKFLSRGTYEDAIVQRRHQAKEMMKRKVLGTTDTTQARNQACCLR